MTTIVRCRGKNCPNGGVTHLTSDDTLLVGRKAYCSSCRKQVEKTSATDGNEVRSERTKTKR
jgi:hypothetical protein